MLPGPRPLLQTPQSNANHVNYVDLQTRRRYIRRLCPTILCPTILCPTICPTLCKVRSFPMRVSPNLLKNYLKIRTRTSNILLTNQLTSLTFASLKFLILRMSYSIPFTPRNFCRNLSTFPPTFPNPFLFTSSPTLISTFHRLHSPPRSLNTTIFLFYLPPPLPPLPK